jgi:hypothetical protein
MNSDQIYRVKAKSRYDAEDNKWTVPQFIFKAKEVSFPKLAANRLKNMVDEVRDNNIVEFNKEEIDTQEEARKTNNFNGKISIYQLLTINLEYHSNSQNSYENKTGYSENKYETMRSQKQQEMHHKNGKFRSTDGSNKFFSPEYNTESKNMRERSQDSIRFNSKPSKMKTLKQLESNAKDEHPNNRAHSKLPPSIRWVSTDPDNLEQDFFGDVDDRYCRNPKAIAQLAPLASNKK